MIRDLILRILIQEEQIWVLDSVDKEDLVEV
jgi:hypothetical protein